MKKTIIIHRWGGNPNSDWYPWIKKELEASESVVFIPEMPNTEEPKINEWISKITEICPNLDASTTFIGHSIGCQAILRYFETLKPDAKVGNVVLVAPWTKLKPIILEEDGAEEIAKPWLETPIEWDKINKKANKFTAIFSTDDYYVYSEEAKLFEDKLNANTLVIENKGHFTEDDSVISLEEILNLL